MDAIDIVTVHRYPKTTPPEEVETELQRLNSVMDRYDQRKPIWVTEHGYYGDDDPSMLPLRFRKHTSPLPCEQAQAEHSIRLNVIAMANGVEKIFYQAGRCTRLNHDNIEGVFFEFGGAPRKIYAAVAAFAHMLCPDARSVKRLEQPSETRAYMFRRGNRHVLVTWDPTASGKHTLRILDARMRAYDIMANVVSERAVELTPAPIYVVATGMTAPEIEQGTRIER